MVCTGPWWSLADELDHSGSESGRTVVVDHDEDLGYLSILVVDVLDRAVSRK
jgi:hypothetical protein